MRRGRAGGDMTQQQVQQQVQQPRTAAGWWARLLPLWGLLGGLVLGAAWGGLARLWMRLLATGQPSFSWSGTLLITGLFAVAGMMAGAVWGARRRRWRGGPMRALRLLGCTGTAVLSLGQGAVMAPTLLCGGLLLAGRGGRTWVRVTLGLVALGPVAAVHALAWSDWPHSPLRLAAAFVLCLVVYTGAAAALAQSYAPAPGAALAGRAWLGLLLVPLMLLVTVGAGSSGPSRALAVLVVVVAVSGAAVLAVRHRARTAVVPQQRDVEARAQRDAQTFSG